jgi:hypothetical protein
MEHQLSLELDGPTRRDRGMATATAATSPELRTATRTAIAHCADRPYAFTVEDVRRQLERDGWNLTGISPGFLGAAIRSAASDGLIVTYGMTIPSPRPDAHSRRLLLWHPSRKAVE